MEETDREDEIECPYCGDINEDVCEEENGIYECPKCGKISELSIEVTTRFIATPDCKLNGEEHNFVKDSTFDNAVICTKCYKIKSLN